MLSTPPPPNPYSFDDIVSAFNGVFLDEWNSRIGAHTLVRSCDSESRAYIESWIMGFPRVVDPDVARAISILQFSRAVSDTTISTETLNDILEFIHSKPRLEIEDSLSSADPDERVPLSWWLVNVLGWSTEIPEAEFESLTSGNAVSAGMVLASYEDLQGIADSLKSYLEDISNRKALEHSHVDCNSQCDKEIFDRDKHADTLIENGLKALRNGITYCANMNIMSQAVLAHGVQFYAQGLTERVELITDMIVPLLQLDDRATLVHAKNALVMYTGNAVTALKEAQNLATEFSVLSAVTHLHEALAHSARVALFAGSALDALDSDENIPFVGAYV